MTERGRRGDYPHDPTSPEAGCAWCALPPAGHGTRSLSSIGPGIVHDWTAPGNDLITDRGRHLRGLPWRTARFQVAFGTLVLRPGNNGPSTVDLREADMPRQPAQTAAEATTEGGAYPSDPPYRPELLRRVQDFDRCPSEIWRHDGRYRCTLARPHPDPHSAHGVTWTDDDPRVVITGIGLPVREAEPLRTINRDSDRDSDFRPLCLARHNGMICDRQAGHQGAHVDIYGPLDDHTWSDEPGTCPHGHKPPAAHCGPAPKQPPTAAHGCDDCSVEPGEPHRWAGCPALRRTA